MSTRRVLCQSTELFWFLPGTASRFCRSTSALPFNTRFFSETKKDDNVDTSSSLAGVEWRKMQLDKLERKFNQPSTSVEKEEDLQPMWKEMESRVTRRKPRTVQQNGGKTGRTNVRKTDEEVWLREGLYDEQNSSH